MVQDDVAADAGPEMFTCSTCRVRHRADRLASMDGEPPVCTGCAEK